MNDQQRRALASIVEVGINSDDLMIRVHLNFEANPGIGDILDFLKRKFDTAFGDEDLAWDWAMSTVRGIDLMYLSAQVGINPITTTGRMFVKVFPPASNPSALEGVVQTPESVQAQHAE